MKIVEGDLIELALAGEFDLIVHGCNCFCKMGAGIASSIKEVFPEAYEADLNTKIGYMEKLGTISSAEVYRDGVNLTIINGYTQFTPSGEGVLVDYDAVGSVFNSIKKEYSGQRVGYPMIGAGLAKGDWGIIAEIIKNALPGEDHTLVKYIEKGR